MSPKNISATGEKVLIRQPLEPPEDRFCDLVMKGGITSGVVYPHAISLLSHHYRFRGIGGTSAGAIAAAITAAAEYQRREKMALAKVSIFLGIFPGNWEARRKRANASFSACFSPSQVHAGYLQY